MFFYKFILYNNDKGVIMNRLKETRKALGKNQTAVANMINISQQAYANYENESSQPTKDMMISLSKVLGKSVSYLFCLDESETSVEKKEVPELTPQQKILLENITKLTDIECIKVNGYIEGLILNRINEKRTTLINISEE